MNDTDSDHAVFLRGKRVTLAPVEESDLAFAQKVINRPDVRPGLTTCRPMSMDDEREWFDSLGDDDHVLVSRADGERVGVIGLHEDPEPWGTAEMGYYVHPDHWGEGYATDAARQVVRYGFDERRLHKVHAGAYAPNEASQRVLEKVGFEREGVRREHVYRAGEHVDRYEYGLLREEWREGA